jgi:hypothetical protein
VPVGFGEITFHPSTESGGSDIDQDIRPTDSLSLLTVFAEMR